MIMGQDFSAVTLKTLINTQYLFGRKHLPVVVLLVIFEGIFMLPHAARSQTPSEPLLIPELQSSIKLDGDRKSVV